MERSVPLLRVRRGGHEESLHRGFVAVQEGERLLGVLGDPRALVFYRSASKPLQALAGITSGAADAFGLLPAELALATGSHNGAPLHVAAARSILAKAGVPESALGCGGHWSIDHEVAQQQRVGWSKPPAVLSNCSGKHALMLAGAQHLGASLEGYLAPTHPLQQRIRAELAVLGGVPVEQVRVAVDGCGAPTFALPLAEAARSVVRLATPQGLPEALEGAVRRTVAAMQAHPEMVAGEGRFDTELMRAGKGAFVAKGGAEGVHMVAAPGRGLALLVKVADGSDRGYRLVVLELLRRLGLLGAAEAEALGESQASRTQKNWSGTVTGELEVLLPEQFP
ncbi:MAG: asparaginase [Planctomycetia bacterium]